MTTMKVYISARRQNGVFQYGLAIYDPRGKLLHSSTKHESDDGRKFSLHIKAMEWGIQKLRTLGQNRKIDTEVPLILVTSSKTIYLWFTRETAPEPYTQDFANLLLHTEFLLNPTTLIHNKDIHHKVRFKNSDEDTPMRVSDVFKE